MNSTTGTFNASVSVYPSNDTSGATNGTMMGSGGVGSAGQSEVSSEGVKKGGIRFVEIAAGAVVVLGAAWLL